MLKDIQKGLSSFFTKEKVLVVLIFLLLSWLLYSYFGLKSSGKEYLTNIQPSPLLAGAAQFDEPAQPIIKDAGSSIGAPSKTVQPSDLLPTDSNTEWTALNPNSLSQGDMMMPDLLQAGYHIGLDTIGQTLRNPNYQLRSDPFIPKQDTGPWNQSTIEADLGRVSLDIGDSR